MKQTVTFYIFECAFANLDMVNQFSRDGLRALFNWFEDYDTDLASCDQPETELDVISICCEFTEYEDLAEFQDNYGTEDYPDIKSIQNHTTVIEVNDESFIIANF